MISLTIITRNQNKKEKAEKLAKEIINNLNIDSEINIEKYHKYDNSFKITLSFKLDEQGNDLTCKILSLTNDICSPWIITYNDGITELVFNSNNYPHNYSKNSYNVIEWANLFIN